MTREQCKAARQQLGWTQRELSQKARVTLRYVEAFECGQLKPNRTNLARMQLALLEAGVNVNAMENGDRR